MSTKQQAQTKVQKPEPARQTAVTETAQLGLVLLPARLGQVDSLHGLPNHGTAREVHQTFHLMFATALWQQLCTTPVSSKPGSILIENLAVAFLLR